MNKFKQWKDNTISTMKSIIDDIDNISITKAIVAIIIIKLLIRYFNTDKDV